MCELLVCVTGSTVDVSPFFWSVFLAFVFVKDTKKAHQIVSEDEKPFLPIEKKGRVGMK